ncbi:unnamed protein product [Peronospora effusa]|nr:unnamed protein product [Peronospora effusa]
MRLSLFLLLVTLTCIACDSIVASSKGLIQVKTVDTNSQHERTDEIHRKLRKGGVGEVVGAQEAEKLTETLGNIKGGAETLVPNADVMAKKIGVLEKMKGYSSSAMKQFIALLKKIYGRFQQQLKKLHRAPKHDAKAKGSTTPLATNKESETQKVTDMKEGVDTQKVTGKEASPHLDNKDVTTEPKIARPDAKEDNVVKPTETTKEVTGKQNSVPEEDNVVEPKSGENAEIHAGEGENDAASLRASATTEEGNVGKKSPTFLEKSHQALNKKINSALSIFKRKKKPVQTTNSADTSTETTKEVTGEHEPVQPVAEENVVEPKSGAKNKALTGKKAHDSSNTLEEGAKKED